MSTDGWASDVIGAHGARHTHHADGYPPELTERRTGKLSGLVYRYDFHPDPRGARLE